MFQIYSDTYLSANLLSATIETFSGELTGNNCRNNDSGLRKGLQNTPLREIPKLSSNFCKNDRRGRTCSLEKVMGYAEKESYNSIAEQTKTFSRFNVHCSKEVRWVSASNHSEETELLCQIQPEDAYFLLLLHKESQNHVRFQ